MSKTLNASWLLLAVFIVGLSAFSFSEKAQAAVVFENTADNLIAGPFASGFIPRDNSYNTYSGGAVPIYSIQVSGYTRESGNGTDTVYIELQNSSAGTCDTATYSYNDLGVTEDEVGGTAVFLEFSSPCMWDGGQITFRVGTGTTAGVIYAENIGGNNHIAFKMLDSGGLPPPPPTEDYNEVIDYIYDPVIDTGFGTSTVGVIWNIAIPDWVESIGYDLLDPTGVVVDTDFVNDPVAGTYEIKKEYEFNATGNYEVKAWYVQLVGENYVKTYNSTTLLIAINAQPWEFDPITGDLVPVGTTTIATSTLDRFKINCPDDLLVGSLCKLAVGLFVPKPQSISGISVAFNTLMEKAPFSFFTQSKKILDAFRTTGSGTPGVYSITYNGVTSPFLSPDIVTDIGLTEERINYLKFIIRVILWVLFAWYLYGRVASIFGV